MDFCANCGAARSSQSAKYCANCGLDITAVTAVVANTAPPPGNAAQLEPHLMRSAPSPALRDEIARRTTRGWQIVAQSEMGVQLRKPKHFSFGWAVLWFVVGIILLLLPFVVYLLWHWAKKDDHVFISVNENGTLAISDRSRVWAAIVAYIRWGASRSRFWQKSAALLAPPSAAVALLTLVVVASVVQGGDAPEGSLNVESPTGAREASGPPPLDSENRQAASAELRIVQTAVDAQMANTGATSTTEITVPTNDMTAAVGGFGLSPTYVRSTSTRGTYTRDTAGNVTQISYP
jgi:hypothetical protein